MNRARRRRLAEALEKAQEALSEIEALRDDEENALECLPDNLKESARAQAMEEAYDTLSTSYDELEALIANLAALVD